MDKDVIEDKEELKGDQDENQLKFQLLKPNEC
jgi:hypothetical protein